MDCQHGVQTQHQILPNWRRCREGLVGFALSSTKETSYKDRLDKLNWMSLEARRQKHTISFTVKCVFNLVDCQSVKSDTTVNTRHLDTLTFNHHYARTETLKNTPSHVFPRIWSSLPSHIKDSLLTDSFVHFNSSF